MYTLIGCGDGREFRGVRPVAQVQVILGDRCPLSYNLRGIFYENSYKRNVFEVLSIASVWLSMLNIIGIL